MWATLAVLGHNCCGAPEPSILLDRFDETAHGILSVLHEEKFVSKLAEDEKAPNRSR